MNNQFSENLKKIRKENNISQEDLAQDLGVSRQSISKWENGDSYPEMDKIIALCDKFNLNIDDLLHKDVKELKREEASKKTINQYIDDFLKFITETVTLFSKMSFKSKVKCVFEQIIIAVLLTIICLIIGNIFDSLILSILSFLPSGIKYFISNIINNILAVLLLLTSIIIIINTFKTRYLNYYEKMKQQDIKETEENIEEKATINLKKKEIIIRDPKHSEYKFINGLFKFIIIMIKFFALCFSLSICATIVGLFIAFIISFLICKTGLFFIGILFTILSSSVIAILLLLLILNFVFNRKNNKKIIIWSFIISLIVFGIGCGLAFLGALDFEILPNESIMEKRQIEYNMNEKLFIMDYENNIKYVERDIENIKIEYKVNKYCENIRIVEDEKGIYLISECNNFGKISKEIIKNINDKKIIPITDTIEDITIYASKENIEKMKNNLDEYNKKIELSYEESNRKRIDELESKVQKYKEKEIEYKEKIYDLESKIEELTEE